jgi:hypothetical protein
MPSIPGLDILVPNLLKIQGWNLFRVNARADSSPQVAPIEQKTKGGRRGRSAPLLASMFSEGEPHINYDVRTIPHK